MEFFKKFPVIIAIIFLSGCSMLRFQNQYDYSAMDWKTRRVHNRVENFLQECKQKGKPVQLIPQTDIDSIYVNAQDKDIKIYFNEYFSHIPFRIKSVDKIYLAVQDKLGWWYRNYDLEIYTLNTTIEQLVPNFYRNDESAYDPTRRPFKTEPRIPLIRRLDRNYKIENGLYGHAIALWHSHGWYYNNELKRWEWQRPRLFQTVEDLLPFSITIPYLIPMLENAGANVFVPRERSLQREEVIVDRDSSQYKSVYKEWSNNDQITWKNGKEPGFEIGTPPYKSGENPFKAGNQRVINSDTTISAGIEWIPDIPARGKYSVYISYNHSDSNATDAHYTIHHAGGETEFLINQQKGGETWIHLGKFLFKEGLNPDSGKLVLTNQSRGQGKVISADAARFGGGMGNIKREGKLSHRPRFEEGARYYLQYAGMPDTLVYNTTNDSDDYKDDYTSRGEWVNYLKGAPYGPNKNRQVRGLGIPIDLSCAFHTDAGITRNGTVIGTLGIYSLEDEKDKRVYPDGVSRLAARDVTDIVQTQLIRDIRAKYDIDWTRRSLYNAKYSEAYRPNVPAILIELFSHQNFTDMKYGMDPRFRFDTGRAIYKGILKFISTQYGNKYIVQPLPVTHFNTEFIAQRKIKLSWRPQVDPVEKTALPEKYKVYTRIEDRGFDNGLIVEDTVHIIKNLKPNVQYSFKVTAVNSGGESFPSEILSVCWRKNSKGRVLIVNGFDRICSPATINKKGFKGFANFIDEGVPYKYDLGYTGRQENFDPYSKWLTNDYPGWGASYADQETQIIAGNTFDYPYIHGKAIKAAGYSYVSSSDEAIIDNGIQLSDYEVTDFIAGEEKTTSMPNKTDSSAFKIFPQKLQSKITNYCSQGGDLFISGAYLGSDMFATPKDSSGDTKFARNVLKYELVTDHAARQGEMFAADTGFFGSSFEFKYNSEFARNIYRVEAPDAIAPANIDSAATILRFRENHFSAGIAYDGNDYDAVLMSIPFETILEEKERFLIMKSVLNFLENN